MSNLRRIMQQELEAIDRRMEHLAAERAKIVSAMKILESDTYVTYYPKNTKVQHANH